MKPVTGVKIRGTIVVVHLIELAKIAVLMHTKIEDQPHKTGPSVQSFISYIHPAFHE
jgi:hypothetical protein